MATHYLAESILKLLIYPNSHDLHFDWFVFDAQGKLHEQGSGDHPPVHLPCQVVLPADRILLTSVKLPKTARRQRDTLLAYAVEDSVLGEPEQQHVVWCGSDENDHDALAVVVREWLTALLQRLSVQGLHPICVVPEILLLPYELHGWSLWLDHGVLRTGKFSGMAVDSSWQEPPTALLLALRDTPSKPQKLTLYLSGDEIPDVAHWQAVLQMEVVCCTNWGRDKQPLACPVNLLQGEFARQQWDWSWLPVLRPALVSLLLLLLLQVVGVGVDWLRLSLEQNRLHAEMNQLFRASFPDAKVVVDAPLQMQRKLTDLQRAAGQPAAGDFLPLLAHVASKIAVLPKISLQSIHYQANELDMTLQLADKQSADALPDQLATAGIEVTLERVESMANGVLAHVSIRSVS